MGATTTKKSKSSSLSSSSNNKVNNTAAKERKKARIDAIQTYNSQKQSFDLIMTIVRQSLLALFVFLPLILILAWMASTIRNHNTPAQTKSPPFQYYHPDEWMKQRELQQQQQQQQQTQPDGSSSFPVSSPPAPPQKPGDDGRYDNNMDELSSSLSSLHGLRRDSSGASISPFVDDDIDCEEISEAMVQAIQENRLTYGRYVALQIVQQHPLCQDTVAQLYTKHSDEQLSERPPGVPLSKIAMKANTDNRIGTSKTRVDTRKDELSCWVPGHDDGRNDTTNIEDASNIAMNMWDTCCSQLSNYDENSLHIQKQCYNVHPTTLQRQRLCCGLYHGTYTYLRLPALQELSLNLRFMISHKEAYEIPIEQEGFLRKYDSSGVLWPTAYLLSLCIAYPEACGVPEILDAAKSTQASVISVELGAGIGVPSIVMSRLLTQHNLATTSISGNGGGGGTPRVLATDKSMHALALVALNSQSAAAPCLVSQIEDHTNTQLLEEMMVRTVETDGYAIVLGSSLQGLFDYKTRDPSHTLWKVLDTLLDPENPEAIAVLSHVVGAVVPPADNNNGPLELIKTISGNHFDMRTRTGDDSDFEISVYRRRPRLAITEL